MKKKLTFISSLIFSLAVTFNSYSADSSVKIKDNQLITDSEISFDGNTDKISIESIESLNAIKDFLKEKDTFSLIRIESHVFTTKDAKEDQDLSMKRSLAIAKWFIDKGIECKRILPVGFGEMKPLEAVGENILESQRVNTRTVIVIAALRNKLIGGMPADGGGLAIDDFCENEENKNK